MMQVSRKILRSAILVTLMSVPMAFAGTALSQTSASQTPDLSAYYAKGKKQAEADAKSRAYVIKTWGLPPMRMGAPCDIPNQLEIRERILTEKYKVRFETVGGCVMTDEDTEFFRGYNEAIEHAVNVKYGEDVFEKAEDEASKELNDKYSDKIRQCDDWLKEIRTLPTKKP